MRDKTFVTVCGAIIVFLSFWCVLSYALEKAGFITLSGSMNYKEPERVYVESLPLSGLLNSAERGKAALYDLSSNYIPFYIDTVYLAGRTGTTLQRFFTGLTGADRRSGDPRDYDTFFIKSNWLFKYYDIYPSGNPDDGFVDTFLSVDSYLSTIAPGRAMKLNRIAARTPGVSFYVYLFGRMQDMEFAGALTEDEASTKPIIDDFFNTLDMSAISGAGMFSFDSVSDRMDKVYRTDHHWNAYGMYAGYRDIINMMRAKTPAIKKPLPLNGVITFEGCILRGSATNNSAYSKYEDIFSVADVPLGPHIMYNEIDFPVENNWEKFKNGGFKRGLPYMDQYADFYIKATRFVYPDNDTGRNLLIVGDSYCWSAAEYIASSFDNTYVYYPRTPMPDFNYLSFIEEHGITDILFAQFSDRTMFNIYNDSSFDALLN